MSSQSFRKVKITNESIDFKNINLKNKDKLSKLIDLSEDIFLDTELLDNLTSKIIEDKANIIARFSLKLSKEPDNNKIINEYVFNIDNIQFIIGSQMIKYIRREKNQIIDILNQKLEINGVKISDDIIIDRLIVKYQDIYRSSGIFDENVCQILESNFNFLSQYDNVDVFIESLLIYQKRWHS